MKKIPLAGVIGCPISHSRSPEVHGYWLASYGISGFYVPMHVETADLSAAITHLPYLGFKGCNVTIPHKEAVHDICDVLSPVAERIGAVNTVTFSDGKIHGDNTDGYGFIAHLRQSCPNVDLRDRKVMVLGAGGAARAVVDALIEAQVATIYVANRTMHRAEELRAHFGPIVEPIDQSLISDLAMNASLIVNTTSVGMTGSEQTKFPLNQLNSETIVYDLVYQPIETELLRFAKSQGCRVVDGFGMLLHQAVPGFERWFGRKPTVTAELYEKILG